MGGVNNGVDTAAGVPWYEDTVALKQLSKQLNFNYLGTSIIPTTTCTDHTAELAKGGTTVVITGMAHYNGHPYVKGADTIGETPEPDEVELHINKSWEIARTEYNLDRKQSLIPDAWTQWFANSGKEAAMDIQGLYLADIVGSPDTNNIGANAGAISHSINLGTFQSPLSIKSSTFSTYMKRPGIVLDEQKVPDENRYIDLPPWLTSEYVFSDMGKAYISGDTVSMMRNANINKPFDRFTVNRVPNMPVATNSAGQRVTTVLFGDKNAIIYWEQFKEIASAPAKDVHGQVISQVWVYGYLAHKPKGIGIMYVTPDLTPG